MRPTWSTHCAIRAWRSKRADTRLKPATIDVAAGDYIVRADQPYRTLADMYFSVQNYPAANPRPYDDTGWTMQYMRNVKLTPVTDKSVLDQPMKLFTPTPRPRAASTAAAPRWWWKTPPTTR